MKENRRRRNWLLREFKLIRKKLSIQKVTADKGNMHTKKVPCLFSARDSFFLLLILLGVERQRKVSSRPRVNACWVGSRLFDFDLINRYLLSSPHSRSSQHLTLENIEICPLVIYGPVTGWMQAGVFVSFVPLAYS